MSVRKKVKMLLVYKYLGTYLVWAHGINTGRMVRSPVSSATPLARLTSGWCGVIRAYPIPTERWIGSGSIGRVQMKLVKKSC